MTRAESRRLARNQMVDSIIVLRRETRAGFRRLARNHIANSIILVLDIEESVEERRETRAESRMLARNQSVRYLIESLIVIEAKEVNHITIINRKNDRMSAESTTIYYSITTIINKSAVFAIFRNKFYHLYHCVPCD